MWPGPHDFGGPKAEATPYPSAVGVRGSARRLRPDSPASPLWAFRGSALHRRVFIARTPSAVEHSVSPVARLKAPHAGQVERALRDSHPSCPLKALALSPWAGFAPALHHCGLTPFHSARCFPVAPLPGSRCASSRTPGLLCPKASRLQRERQGQDYAGEPSSNRTSHSHGIRLYEPAPWRVVSPAPCVWLVAKLDGWCRPS